jgi:hypothetical protein
MKLTFRWSRNIHKNMSTDPSQSENLDATNEIPPNIEEWHDPQRVNSSKHTYNPN